MVTFSPAPWPMAAASSLQMPSCSHSVFAPGVDDLAGDVRAVVGSPEHADEVGDDRHVGERGVAGEAEDLRTPEG